METHPIGRIVGACAQASSVREFKLLHDAFQKNGIETNISACASRIPRIAVSSTLVLTSLYAYRYLYLSPNALLPALTCRYHAIVTLKGKNASDMEKGEDWGNCNR